MHVHAISKIFLCILLLENFNVYGMAQAPQTPKTTKEKNLQISAPRQLFKAARKGNIIKIKQLISLPYLDVNHVDQRGNSALHVIKARTDTRACTIAHLLLEHGASVHIKNQKNETPLHTMARKGYAQTIALLLANGASEEINAQANNGATALHKAVIKKWIAATHALITAGALLDIRDKDGNTVLNIAAILGHEEIEEELVNAGARLDIKNNGGFAPIDAPKVRNKWHIKLRDAIEKNIDNTLVKKLLDQGLNPNYYLSVAGSTQFGKLHLSVALSRGNRQTVCLLLDAGANPLAEDLFTDLVSHSLCIQALKNGTVDMAQLLITHVPKIRIATQRNALREPFKTMLICVNRLGTRLPLDLRKLLFGQCMIDTLLPELENNAHAVCKKIPWSTYNIKYDAPTKDKFDCSKLAQYHRTWKEQIIRYTH